MKKLEQFAPNVQLSTETILKSAESTNYKNVLWTSDIKQELPIFLGNDQSNSVRPRTMIELFESSVSEEKDNKVLFIERDQQWIHYTWNQFHKYVINFAKAVISIGVEPYQTVNILANNSPEWFFSFIGGIYSCVVPVGIYITNNTESCVYIANHSDCGVLVVDSIEQYKKYETKLSELKRLKAVVIFGKTEVKDIKALLNQYVPIYTWEDFIEIGKKANVELELQNRIERQKPGNCCDVVYTSGTTGNPKAVLLSHDNLTYTAATSSILSNNLIGENAERLRTVSYLPLSHIAGQMVDIMGK